MFWDPNLPFYLYGAEGNYVQVPGLLLVSLLAQNGNCLYMLADPCGGPFNPCANGTLAAAGVNAQGQIAMAQAYIAAGKAVAGAASWQYGGGPPFTSLGGLVGYYYAVQTYGPNDIKHQPGHSPLNLNDVDAGNISFGITCPYGATFCQVGAGVAQLGAALVGKASLGSPSTFMDSPSDNASIRIGQQNRAAGCHE